MKLLVFAACISITGCATIRLSSPPAALRPGEIAYAQAAKDAVTVGKSSKADVRAALGDALVIDFDSGYEVWVYRERPAKKQKPPPAPAEFVLLFPPSGILAKTRIR